MSHQVAHLAALPHSLCPPVPLSSDYHSNPCLMDSAHSLLLSRCLPLIKPPLCYNLDVTTGLRRKQRCLQYMSQTRDFSGPRWANRLAPCSITVTQKLLSRMCLIRLCCLHLHGLEIKLFDRCAVASSGLMTNREGEERFMCFWWWCCVRLQNHNRHSYIWIHVRKLNIRGLHKSELEPGRVCVLNALEKMDAYMVKLHREVHAQSISSVLVCVFVPVFVTSWGSGLHNT